MKHQATARACPRRSRSKTGCLCCRLRRKKCTEEKPICTSCKKLGLPCSWPQPSEFAWRLRMGIAGDTPAREAIDYLSQVSSRLSKTQASDTSTGASPTTSSSNSGDSSSPPPWFSDFITEHLHEVADSHSSPLPLSGGPVSGSANLPQPDSTPSAELGSTTIPPTAPPSKRPRRQERTELSLVGIRGTWASLDPMSQNVLRYYVDYTSDRLLSQKPGATNVWQSTVLQFAESDELVLNAVLAVGSVHLAASMVDNRAVEEATTRYVLRSITGLQRGLERWVGNSSTVSDETLRLMLVTCLLAEHEESHPYYIGPVSSPSMMCIGGNFNGTLQLHLRASHPIARVLESKHTSGQAELVACLLEYTARLQFLSGLCFPGPDDESRAADSLELVRLVHEGRFPLLKSCDMFGAYFGCAAELYERPEHRAARAEAERIRRASESAMVASARVVQKTLLLFLISAYMRGPEDHDRLVAATQPIVDEALDVFEQIRGTTWENTTWWPIVIVGAYATSQEQRDWFFDGLGSFTPPMGIVLRGRELLRKVWDAPDDVFELDGLSRLVGGSGAYCFG
ncbi:hypothetical protein B0J18DRAFT_459962 [Chaetomium sp. MPI-SDFR-AT-0129]|nr:hypothetical protein B0J18DRAFT_459962 [Chaetomium sp. MPI-SDFR-AT-0129]